MREANVYFNFYLAGILKEENGFFWFVYNDAYFENQNLPAISLTLPKTKKEYRSKELFSFFQGLLQEGWLKGLSESTLRIDKDDEFALLVKNGKDCIGNVSLQEIISE
jgi:serine/threonine-protein kinase HipA